jgi:hypothetical protein
MVEKNEVNAPVEELKMEENANEESSDEPFDENNPYLAKCRFYRNEVPDEGDLVMVVIQKME